MTSAKYIGMDVHTEVLRDDTLAAKALHGGALVCCHGTVLSRILQVSGEECLMIRINELVGTLHCYC
jgi:hypothetical protein